MPELKKVLEKLNSGNAYRSKDRKALDISRALAAGNVNIDKNYMEWAALTDDPLVVANYVSTYITTLVNKLSSSPFRPEDDRLYQLGSSACMASVFTEVYLDVLNDGYAFLAVGMEDGMPVVRPVDSRYIAHNGDSPTIGDATEVVVFQIVPRPLEDDEKERLKELEIPLLDYVEYDSDIERVIVSHYHLGKDGVTLSIYDGDYGNPEVQQFTSLNRIPVVRFAGARVELGDRRYHYRGIYYMMQTVMKAMTVTGTKLARRAVSSDDDNYIVRADAISNEDKSWDNSGAKTVANVDQNGNEIPVVQFIPHDNDFLLASFNTWKSVVADMLGPTVASGSEAVTREEVLARTEVKESISNIYLSKMVDSIEEVYRIVQMFTTGVKTKVVIIGGYIDAAKRQKQIGSLVQLYQYAKDGGLNTQEFVKQMLNLSDLPTDTKQALAVSFTQDPFKSPQVIQLQQIVTRLIQRIQQQDTQIALLRLQATQRLERQKEFIDSNERTKRLEIAFKQWQTEQQQTQAANMALLQDCLDKMDYDGAIRVMEEIRKESNPLITDNIINMGANAFTAENAASVEKALDSTSQMPASTGTPATMTSQQNQTANVMAPAARPAVTVFDDT